MKGDTLTSGVYESREYRRASVRSLKYEPEREIVRKEEEEEEEACEIGGRRAWTAGEEREPDGKT